MKIVKSDLVQKDFFIVKNSFEFIEPTEKKININQIFNEYKIDFDFIAREEENNLKYIFVKVEINMLNNPLAGYKIFAEGVCIFEFDINSKLSDEQKIELLSISGLSIAINNLRSYISNITMYYPFGKFTLPTIDLGPLYEEKNKQIKK